MEPADSLSIDGCGLDVGRPDVCPKEPMGASEVFQETPMTFVVDDDGIVRRDIRSILERGGMRVRDFSTSEAFLEAYHPGHRDILRIDAYLPGMSGLQLLWSLKSSGSPLTSIMVTGGTEMALGVEAMRAGACDVIQKPFLEEQLLIVVGRAQILAGQNDKDASWHEEADRLVTGLTPRQLEVMNLVLAGQPSKNIAADLGISQRTVENHRAAVMRKAGSRSLPALARLAFGVTR